MLASSAEDVQERVADWLERLKGWFQETETWADEHGWTAFPMPSVPMNEDPMLAYKVRPAEQPVLKVQGPDGRYALFKPKGLWVIGANGRIDLYTSKGAFVLLDRAETFQEPLWRIFRATSEREGLPYDPALLADLV